MSNSIAGNGITLVLPDLTDTDHTVVAKVEAEPQIVVTSAVILELANRIIFGHPWVWAARLDGGGWVLSRGIPPIENGLA